MTAPRSFGLGDTIKIVGAKIVEARRMLGGHLVIVLENGIEVSTAHARIAEPPVIPCLCAQADCPECSPGWHLAAPEAPAEETYARSLARALGPSCPRCEGLGRLDMKRRPTISDSPADTHACPVCEGRGVPR